MKKYEGDNFEDFLANELDSRREEVEQGLSQHE